MPDGGEGFAEFGVFGNSDAEFVVDAGDDLALKRDDAHEGERDGGFAGLLFDGKSGRGFGVGIRFGGLPGTRRVFLPRLSSGLDRDMEQKSEEEDGFFQVVV